MQRHDVLIASILPLYKWSGPDGDERLAAVRYWRRAIELAVEVGCDTMNSEFNGTPQHSSESEAQFWRSLEELLPLFEREGIRLNLEPHPGDFEETNAGGVDLVRAVNSPNVGYVYCAPHSFYLGRSLDEMIRCSSSVLRHVHLADTFDHTASSGLRYILSLPGTRRGSTNTSTSEKVRSTRGALRLTRRCRIRRHPHELRVRVGRTSRGFVSVDVRLDHRSGVAPQSRARLIDCGWSARAG